NLKKRMKEVEHLDIEKLRGSATRPHYLEEPPRLFAKELPEGSRGGVSVRDRGTTLDVVREAYDKGYMIVAQEGDPTFKTPLLVPRPGVEPTGKFMIVADPHPTNRHFQIVRNDLDYPDPNPGHQWSILDPPRGPQKYQMRAIYNAEPEQGFRWHYQT